MFKRQSHNMRMAAWKINHSLLDVTVHGVSQVKSRQFKFMQFTAKVISWHLKRVDLRPHSETTFRHKQRLGHSYECIIARRRWCNLKPKNWQISNKLWTNCRKSHNWFPINSWLSIMNLFLVVPPRTQSGSSPASSDQYQQLYSFSPNPL